MGSRLAYKLASDNFCPSQNYPFEYRLILSGFKSALQKQYLNMYRVWMCLYNVVLAEDLCYRQDVHAHQERNFLNYGDQICGSSTVAQLDASKAL